MKLLTIAVVFFCITDLFPQKVGDAYQLNINNIYLPLNSKGILADANILPNGSGGQFGGNVFLFSGGFFLSGYSNGTLWANACASSTLVEDYLPGTWGSPNHPNAQLYKIRSDDPPFGLSWVHWSDAVNLGADFYDGNGDQIYTPVDLNGNSQWDPDEDRPDILGDEMLWCVYYDGFPIAQRRWNTTIYAGIEVRQTVFAYDYIPALQNIIFIRYRIKNTGITSDELTDVYFGVWDDPDIGGSDGYTDDLFGCDTVYNGGYAYNDGPDPAYGNNPPSFFASILSGPRTYIPGETFIDINGNGIYDEGIDTAIDTAIVNRGQVLGIIKYPGARNQVISSMLHYINGDPNLNDPTSKEEARNYMLGLSKLGVIIDPCVWGYGEVRGGVNCSEVNPFYWYSGDPVTNYGWINIAPADQRQLQNVGPFTLKEGEEYEVFVAYNVGQGSDALTSVSEVKNIALISDVLHDTNFDTLSVVSVKELSSDNIPSGFYLAQNYQNPFNPSTRIKFTISDFGFTSLKIYDVLGNEVATLVDRYKPAGTYEVEWTATGLPSGIYFYQLKTEGFVETKKMILMK